MAKYKDTDRLMAILENRCDEADNVEAWLAYAIACEDVRDLPVADVVEVVRCKDCKWFGDIGCAIRIVDDSDRPSENDFCSFAERKDNG